MVGCGRSTGVGINQVAQRVNTGCRQEASTEPASLRLSNSARIVVGCGRSTDVGINQVAQRVNTGCRQEASTEPASLRLSNSARTVVGCGRITGVGINQVAQRVNTGCRQEASTEPVNHVARQVKAGSTEPASRHCAHPPAVNTYTSTQFMPTPATTTTRRPTPVSRMSISAVTTRVTTTTTVPLVSGYRVTTLALSYRRRNVPPVLASTATLCSITMSTVTTTTPVPMVRCPLITTSALMCSRRRLLLLFRGLSAALLPETV